MNPKNRVDKSLYSCTLGIRHLAHHGGSVSLVWLKEGLWEWKIWPRPLWPSSSLDWVASLPMRKPCREVNLTGCISDRAKRRALLSWRSRLGMFSTLANSMMVRRRGWLLCWWIAPDVSISSAAALARSASRPCVLRWTRPAMWWPCVSNRAERSFFSSADVHCRKEGPQAIVGLLLCFNNG